MHTRLVTSSPASPVSLARFRLMQLALALLPALVLALGVQEVEARRGWCRVDPVVRIDGQLAHVWVASTVGMRQSATGPILVDITLPPGISGAEVPEASGAGFGFGIVVTVKESTALRATPAGVQVQVAVYAPADDDALPVQVVFKAVGRGPLSSGTAVGSAGDWVTLTTGP